MSEAQSPRAIILCADDYGLTEGVSRAILELIDAGRLSATSAFATMPSWPELAHELAARRGRVGIGLHLDLTQRPFGGVMPPLALRQLMIRALSGRLEASALRAEFERQFDAFEDALGAPPDHVDGHHHVHVLPVVRDALRDALARRYRALPRALRPMLRDPADRWSRILARRVAIAKAAFVSRLGAGFGQAMAAAGFRLNDGFAGFAKLAQVRSLDAEFNAFLQAPGPRHLVMCHPGFADASLAQLDSLGARREGEHRLLMARDDIQKRILRIDRPRDAAGGAFAHWLA